jgi:hypothetical protein
MVTKRLTKRVCCRVGVAVHGDVSSARRRTALAQERPDRRGGSDDRVTEIVLTTIGLAPTLRDSLVLKGGTLMALAFDSRRLTADIDFTALLGPEGFETPLTEELNALLPKAAIQLGHLDLVCRVQSVKKMPRAQNFADHDFPALRVRIGSALRGTPEEKHLDSGQATRVLDMEISFRDQVYTDQTLQLSDAGVAIRAFTLHELIAEKFRALLQQPIRNRYRRQVVYDIAYLIDAHPFEEADRKVIHETLVEKCASRDILLTGPNGGPSGGVKLTRSWWG